MRSKSLLSLLAIAALTLSLGCGGGGGGGSSTPIKTDTVIRGSIAAAGTNPGLLTSARAAVGDGIDYSNLTVAITGTSISVHPNADGTFSVTLTSLTGTTVDLIVKNSAGKTIMGQRIFNVYLGEDKNPSAINATTTALLRIALDNPTYGEAELDWLSKDNGFTAVLSQFLTILGNGTLGNFQTDSIVMNTLPAIPNPATAVIRDAYANMSEIMKNNNLSANSRIAQFMTYFSTNFRDTNGTLSYNDLMSSTQSRFERYTVNGYALNIRSVKYSGDLNTIDVETQMYGNLSKKPGADGSVSQATGYITKSSDGSNPVITWKNENGTWRIIKGFPFRSSEPYKFGSISIALE